jgi:hypothetical protein
MIDQKSGVQGVLTLNYNSHEEKDNVVTSALQLFAGEKNSVVLMEYKQDKEIEHENYKVKENRKYEISTEELVSLIKSHGRKLS